MKKRLTLLVSSFCSVSFLGVASVASGADLISPSSLNLTLREGEQFTLRKIVTVGEEVGGTAQLDIAFLTDTTGSMGGFINTVQTSFSDILEATSELGDVQWSVGEYRDITDDFIYRLNEDFTADQLAVTNGINMYSAAGGGDLPEANFFALEETATVPSWRTGSTRLAVWAGDAVGHDPRNGSTEASATAALQAQNIVVQAINLLNPGQGIDQFGQATRVADATGGSVQNNPEDVVDAIAIRNDL
ncbi:hypothetical protein [Crocosphaera sp. Alani8]|uniref:hypothetical protein n=1 Tax=Crocosphaera sp. Alani8 TaxID=3038952 RepID=UPI00313B9A25